MYSAPSSPYPRYVTIVTIVKVDSLVIINMFDEYLYFTVDLLRLPKAHHRGKNYITCKPALKQKWHQKSSFSEHWFPQITQRITQSAIKSAGVKLLFMENKNKRKIKVVAFARISLMGRDKVLKRLCANSWMRLYVFIIFVNGTDRWIGYGVDVAVPFSIHWLSWY